MKTLQIIATANNEVIEQLKVAIEGVFGQFHHQKTDDLTTQVEIVDLPIDEPVNKVVENDTLFGMFSHYVTHRLHDEDIKDGIAQGAYERAMRGVND